MPPIENCLTSPFSALPTFSERATTAIQIALGVITLGGGIVAGLAIVSYLPPYAVFIGGVSGSVALIAFAVVSVKRCCHSDDGFVFSNVDEELSSEEKSSVVRNSMSDEISEEREKSARIETLVVPEPRVVLWGGETAIEELQFQGSSFVIKTEGKIYLWEDLNSEDEPKPIPGPAYEKTLHVHSMLLGDKVLFLGLSDGRISTGIDQIFEAHHDAKVTILRVIDNSLLYCGYEDGQITVFGREERKYLKTFKGLSSPITELQIQGSHLLGRSNDGKIYVWNLSTGMGRDYSSAFEQITVVQLSESFLFLGYSDGSLQKANLKTSSWHLNSERHKGGISALQIEGNTFVSGSEDGEIKVWDASEWQVLKTLEGHTSKIEFLKIAGNLLFSSSSDGKIKIWDLSEGECLATLEGGPLFQLQGNTLVSGSHTGKVKAWALDQEQLDSFQNNHSEL